MSHRSRGSFVPFEWRLQRPLIALQKAVDGSQLIKAVFRLLKAAVPCDFVNVSLHIVEEEGKAAMYRVVDSLGREFGPEFMKGAFFQDHPAMPVLMANPGIRFINTRETLPPEKELRRTRFYKEAMKTFGFRHAAGMFFWNSPPTVPEAIFALFRAQGQRDFSDDEIALLDRLYDRIDAALRRVRAVENERVIRDQLHGVVRSAPRAVCFLNWDLRVAESSRAAQELAARWHGAEAVCKSSLFKLPAQVREACLDLKSRWPSASQTNRRGGVLGRALVVHPDGLPLQARITMQLQDARPLARPGFVVEFSEVEKSARRDSISLRELSARDRELVRLVCEGRSNQEIADAIGRSLGTVKNSLHAIYRQLGVSSRAALIARGLRREKTAKNGLEF